MIPLTTWVSEGSAGPAACKQTCHILPWYVFNNAPYSFLFFCWYRGYDSNNYQNPLIFQNLFKDFLRYNQSKKGCYQCALRQYQSILFIKVFANLILVYYLNVKHVLNLKLYLFYFKRTDKYIKMHFIVSVSVMDLFSDYLLLQHSKLYTF